MISTSQARLASLMLLTLPQVVKATNHKTNLSRAAVDERHTHLLGIKREEFNGRQGASDSRNLYLNNHEDFCLFGPAEGSTRISQSGKNVVAFCTKDNHDGRTIPEGTLSGVTYVKANNWVQVSGFGDFTEMNIAPGDSGGQLDYNDNLPEGAKAFVGDQAVQSWVTMISADLFCFRACTGDASYCPTDFATKGCYELLSSGIGPSGTFQSCTSDDGQVPSKQGSQAPEWKNCQSTPSSPSSNGGVSSAASTTSTSEEWRPVETCVPCASSATSSVTGSGATTTSGAGSPGTTQQGVTQLTPTSTGSTNVDNSSGSNLNDYVENGSATTTPKPTSSGSSDDLILATRDDEVETTTKDGKCCFTTWIQGSSSTSSSDPSSISSSTTTAAVGGSASQSGSAGSGSGSKSASGTASQTGLLGLTSSLFSGSYSAAATLSGNVSASGTASGVKNGTGTIGTAGGNGTGNSTGNGSESAAVHTIDPVYIGSSGRMAMALLIALISGVWTVL